jgi:chemotaxis protein CheX
MQTPTVELDRIISDIWAAMLGLTLEPYHDAPVFPADTRVATGVVQITGDFEGAVTIQLTEHKATEVAALMFAMEPEEIGEEEVSDAVGELANMAGGNVKSTLAGSCQLSLPSVTSGRDYHVSVPGTVVRDKIGMICQGELVVITMLAREQR